jgi:hypothetical protein
VRPLRSAKGGRHSAPLLDAAARDARDLAMGSRAFKCPSPLSVLKDTYDRSFILSTRKRISALNDFTADGYQDPPRVDPQLPREALLEPGVITPAQPKAPRAKISWGFQEGFQWVMLGLERVPGGPEGGAKGSGGTPGTPWVSSPGLEPPLQREALGLVGGVHGLDRDRRCHRPPRRPAVGRGRASLESLESLLSDLDTYHPTHVRRNRNRMY